MKSLSIFIILMLPLLSLSQNREIEFFHGTWSETIAKASQQKKSIFVDMGTSWCWPCKWIVSNVFNKDEVADFYNANFVCLKVDVEKTEWRDFAKQWQAKRYPSLLFFDSAGEMIHRSCGAVSFEKFISIGKDALNPEKRLFTVKKIVESGKADNQTQAAYIFMLRDACMDYGEQLEKYWALQKEEDLSKRENWNLIYEFVTDYKSREFSHLIANKKMLEKFYSVDSVNMKIEEVYKSPITRYIYANDTIAYWELLQEIKNNKLSNAEKIILYAEMVNYFKQEDWPHYVKSAQMYIDKYADSDSEMLTSVSWNFYQKIEEKKFLEVALRWAARSVKLQSSVHNMEVYAHLLYKTGNFKKAKIQAEKAIKLAKKEGIEYHAIEILLDKIVKAL